MLSTFFSCRYVHNNLITRSFSDIKIQSHFNSYIFNIKHLGMNMLNNQIKKKNLKWNICFTGVYILIIRFTLVSIMKVSYFNPVRWLDNANVRSYFY